MKRILIGCYEIPGYGGASTATYKLFEMMQQDGLDVHFINLISERDNAYFQFAYGEQCGNPAALKNVHNCILNPRIFGEQPSLGEVIQDIAADIMIGVGYIGALLMKNAATDIPLVFMTTGCYQAEQLIANGTAKDAGELLRYLKKAVNVRDRFRNPQISETIEKSNLIITHSPLTKAFFECFFPYQVAKFYHKITWFAEWIYEDARQYSALRRPFNDRDIDVLFIASSWKRPEKNFPLVKKIIAGIRNRNIHIAGETEKMLPDAVHHGLVPDREVLFSLMSRSKTVVCPSLIDAAPGILFEASAMGCNVITSKNCGNWQLCNEQLLATQYTATCFVEKILLSLDRHYEDNINYFFDQNAYEDLIETITVI